MCPICKGTEFLPIDSGVILKKHVYRCVKCKTILEPVGKVERGEFIVKKVGEQYSNCGSLFEGIKLTPATFTGEGFPIFPDSLLTRYSEGDLTEWECDKIEPLKTPFLPAKNEEIYVAMENVILCEDRYRRGETGEHKIVFRKMEGCWDQTGYLEGPKTMRMLNTRDVGQLILTSRRYLFLGQTIKVDQPLSAVGLVLPFRDGFGIERINKLKREYYEGNYHWPIITSIFAGQVIRSHKQEKV